MLAEKEQQEILDVQLQSHAEDADRLRSHIDEKSGRILVAHPVGT